MHSKEPVQTIEDLIGEVVYLIHNETVTSISINFGNDDYGRRCQDVIWGITRLASGYEPMAKVTMEETLKILSVQRYDIHRALNARNYTYSVSARDGILFAEVTDVESGVMIYGQISDAFDPVELRDKFRNTEVIVPGRIH